MKTRNGCNKVTQTSSAFGPATPDTIQIPAWHDDVVQKTEKLVAIGKVRFSDWETAKRIREKALGKN